MKNIEELTIKDLTNLMDNSEITSLELVEAYLERIAKYNKQGPCLNAVLEINPDALHIAEALDYERKYKGKRGALHGIPILIKDNINTGDKMHTSAGSLALADLYAQTDAHLVKKLRSAGAVILGKSNMTEFSNYMTDKMPAGYSSRGGQVKNPYDVEKTPSGSSAGSAVAVAANLCTVAVGTETRGSIIYPAKANCIVGIKPTVGLISREGIIPINYCQDTAGPMARTVTDAAILLGAMVGVDEKDPATWKSEWNSYSDYTQFLKKDGLKDARIGVCVKYYDTFTVEEKRIFNETIKILKRVGAEVITQDQVYTGLPDEGSLVSRHEFKSAINYYLFCYQKKSGLKSLADIITFNNAHADEALKYGQTVFERAQQTSGTLTEEGYIAHRLRDMRNTRKYGIDKIMDDLKLDALLFLEKTSLAAVAGYPAIIVPAGFSNDGEAYGVTFIGRAFSEPTLLRLAYDYEQVSHKRVPPILD